MYTYKLKITIFSKDETLKKIVNTIRPLPNFVHEVSFLDDFDYNELINSDVLIIDLPIKLALLQRRMKDNAKVLLCSSELDDADYELATEIVHKPINYTGFLYRFQRVLTEIKMEADKKYSEMCLDRLMDTIPDMIWFKSLDGIHTKVNNKFCEVVAKEKKDVEGKDHYYIWNVRRDDPNSGADKCKETEDAVILANRTLQFQESVKVKDMPRQLDTYKTPLVDKDGKIIGTVGFGHDVTDLKNLSVENVAFFENIPFPTLLRDNKGKIRDVNSLFEKYFNVLKADIVGMQYDDWSKKAFLPSRSVNESGFIEATANNSDKNVVELRTNQIPNVFGGVSGNICIFRDVTIEKNLQNKIYEESITDAMTGLFNRRYFNEYVENENLGDVTFLAVDLDHFKSVNDNFGHGYGDKALIDTATILKESFPNDVVIRMGGDEFLIIKRSILSEEEINIACNNLFEKLTRCYENTWEYNGLSASIGVARGNIKTNGVEAILKNSDEALYGAKDAGRACMCLSKKNNNLLPRINPQV